MFDPRIPSTEKAKVGGAIAYFISPVDKNIQEVLRVADELVGSGMWKKSEGCSSR